MSDDIALATDEDALVELTDNSTSEEDGPQDIPQVPIAEDEVAYDEAQFEVAG